MWLLCALLCFLLWGGADLFYKKGNSGDEPYSHLQTCMIVGLVMGLHAAVTLLTSGVRYDLRNLYLYLPVSCMYILSMAIGYFGLKYLQLSVSSPIQNASGAVSCVLLMLVLHRLPDQWSLIAIVLVTAGVIWLGALERSDNLRSAVQADRKHRVGAVAVLFPVLYCVIDSLGTFLDGYYLEDAVASPLAGVTEENIELVANCSYEFTFLIAAVLLFLYVRVIRGYRVSVRGQGSRLIAAVLETAGQMAYVYAMSGEAIVAAPVIGSYCVCSAILARLFLGEKLRKAQYAAVALVFAGILILSILEAVAP